MSNAVAVDDLSLAVEFPAVCPLCGTAFTGRRWRIVDIDARPELVAHLSDGSLFRTYCPACIGPGVEQTGAFSIVCHRDGALQFVHCFPFETTDASGEAARLSHDLEAQCEAAGTPVALAPMGSGLFRDLRDLRERVSETWPEADRPFDPLMIEGPLLSLLNAHDAAARAAALRVAPDLARPNIENLLATFSQQGSVAQRVAAEASRRFVSEARRAGIDAAQKREAATIEPIRRLAERAPTLHEALRDFLSTKPGAAALDATAAAARKLAAELLDAGEPRPAALVWQKCGDLARSVFGARRGAALRVAIDAYQRALDALPGAAAAEPRSESSFVKLTTTSCGGEIR